MEEKLQANDDKKPHWKVSGLSVVMAHLQQEFRELWDSFDTQGPRGQALEAADIACIAMMVADICFGLEEPDDRLHEDSNE